MWSEATTYPRCHESDCFLLLHRWRVVELAGDELEKAEARLGEGYLVLVGEEGDDDVCELDGQRVEGRTRKCW